MTNTAPPADDAALLELGRKLDPIIEEWAATIRENDKRRAALENEVFAATGIRIDTGQPRTPASAYWNAREKILEGRSDPAHDDRLMMQWDEIDERAKPLLRAIFALPALTIGGLAVKARAIAFWHSDFWRNSADPNDRMIAQLFDEICAAAGVRSLAADVGSFAENVKKGAAP
jgi:hypothetical protein